MSSAAIWRVTSRTSSARAAIYSSSISANISAYSSPTASTAASGLSRFRMRSSTPEESSGSSANSMCASKMAASSSPADSRRRSPVSESFLVTASTASWKCCSSASISSSDMLSRSGSSSSTVWIKAGPTTAPSEAPTPKSLTGSLMPSSPIGHPLSFRLRLMPNSSVLVLRDQLDQGLHGFLCVISLSPDHYLVTLLGSQSHDLHRAFGVGLLFAFDHRYLGVELLSLLDELRRRSGVKPRFGSDRRLSPPLPISCLFAFYSGWRPKTLKCGIPYSLNPTPDIAHLAPTVSLKGRYQVHFAQKTGRFEDGFDRQPQQAGRSPHCILGQPAR